MGPLLSLLGCMAVSLSSVAEAGAPVAQGATLYVSKLGDNSDGLSWDTAFTTIQAALDAVPGDEGGCRIIIRPDTYMEAMLAPAHPGAQGAYNALIGDVDGRFGSGKSGWVIIDSGDASKGFKSYDWWSTMRAYMKGWSKEHTEESFSSIVWDRWRFSGLYTTGGDGGLFFDCVDRIEPFSIIVEDCVGIGRAFGGGVGNCLSRPEEPITFRRCTLWSLDWWGDTAGAYIRVENEAMPAVPDAILEDCTLVSPQCALKVSNYGFKTFTHVKAIRSRLIALNFSQPAGTPTDGIIQSVEHGKYLAIDLEDCTLMGYKVFGVKVNKDTENDITYTTKGAVQAYVQYTQSVPEGILTLGHWPADVFECLVPPSPASLEPPMGEPEIVHSLMCEMTPLIWKGRLCQMGCVRPGHGGAKEDYYLTLADAETGEEFARFAEGYSLGCALVKDDTLYAFASRFEPDNGPWNDVTVFKSSDLEHWESQRAIEQDPDEHLFNSSVCEGPGGYVMAYETNDPGYPSFTVKFAVSQDLINWTKVPDAVFGTDRYTACPCIRYANGFYYMMYLEHRTPRWFFETYIARSKDLKTWEVSRANPVLTPDGIDDGINASDPDIAEMDGKTYLYYAVGDQRTWMNIKRTVYEGPMSEFFERWFDYPEEAPAPVPPKATAPANDYAQQRAQWFNDAKFGMFVHWGLYAVPARNNNGPYVSWMMENEGIPVAEYEKYAAQFKPTKFDPDAWMRIAKSAGMRYLTFTSKHHEGFCMFDSALTDYDAVEQAAGQDFVKGLIKAARDADMKIAFYYSMLDWHHPDFKGDFPKYVDYMHGQVRELCTNYGPIDGVWFDGEWDLPFDAWRSRELVAMIRELQPLAVVNDRLGKGERGVNPLCDFFTREQMNEIGEKAAFEKGKPYAWEACLTIGTSWGYKEGDAPLKSGEELIRALVDIVSRGGNLLLNVGPNAEGEIPPQLVERLDRIGQWMAANGESIYGTHGSPFPALEGAKCTAKDNRLYLHFESRPGDEVVLPGLTNTIKRAWFLASGQELAVDSGGARKVILPEAWPQDAVITIAVELDGEPVVNP